MLSAFQLRGSPHAVLRALETTMEPTQHQNLVERFLAMLKQRHHHHHQQQQQQQQQDDEVQSGNAHTAASVGGGGGGGSGGLAPVPPTTTRGANPSAGGASQQTKTAAAAVLVRALFYASNSFPHGLVCSGMLMMCAEPSPSSLTAVAAAAAWSVTAHVLVQPSAFDELVRSWLSTVSSNGSGGDGDSGRGGGDGAAGVEACSHRHHDPALRVYHLMGPQAPAVLAAALRASRHKVVGDDAEDVAAVTSSERNREESTPQ